jgi:SWI/SNF-related matrix-associated actin-dependent regulator of chromatin subfamily A3
MLEVDTKLKMDGQSKVNGQHMSIFGVRKDSDKMSLTFTDGTDFGVLNEHASKALGKLVDQKSVDLDCLAPTLTLRQTIEKASKQKDAIVRVDINVYGASSARQEVGRDLSDNKIYLQRPDQLRPGLEYDNPHILHFPDMMVVEPFAFAPEPCVTDNPASKSTDVFRRTISDVYSSLQRGSGLNCVEGDDRVKTDLLPLVKFLSKQVIKADLTVDTRNRLWTI